MKKLLVLFGIIILFVIVGLSGCTNPIDVEKNRFIGTWIGSVTIFSLNQTTENMNITFFSNGTYNEGPRKGGIWEINDGQLFMNHTTLRSVLSYSFSNDDTLLILNSTSIKYVLTKQ